MYNWPQEITKIIGDEKVVEITDFHQSGDNVFQIGNKFILKVSARISELQNERNRNDYLVGYLPVPKTVLFIVSNNKAYYLKQYLPGKPLCHPDFLIKPERIVKLLIEAIQMVHSIDIQNCPFFSKECVGETFIHGDFCLPNILVSKNKITGIIDLDSAGIGDPYYDYVWALWSLEYNLKTDKYNHLLIENLNLSIDEIEKKKALYIK